MFPPPRPVDPVVAAQLARIDTEVAEPERVMDVHRGRLGEYAGDRGRSVWAHAPNRRGWMVEQPGPRSASTEWRQADAGYELRLHYPTK